MCPIKTLNQNKDFRRIYARSKAYVHPALVTYILKNRVGFCRFGVTTSRKIGNAVVRNRCRRIIYHAFRNIYNEKLDGFDFVFVARGRTSKLKSTDIEVIICKHIKNFGIIS